ncbi:hypothetical protein KUCAC02_026069, partial [Chaenocephalus aceratus]
MVFKHHKPIDITSTCQGEPQAECWPSLGEGLPIRGWLLSAGGRMSPIQPPLSARQAGCVGRPGSSVADASPHVRGRQWPDGASPQMEMSVSLTGPGSCHCLRPRPLYLGRALPTLT